MSKAKRLQGSEWHLSKDRLVLIKYWRNNNGHVKGLYKDPQTNSKYTHWLNNEEIKELDKTIVKINETKNFIDKLSNEMITIQL